MKTEDLKILREQINKELEVREKYARQKDWNDVVSAIKNYISNHGNILITDNIDDYDLTDCTDFSRIGIIRIMYEGDE